MSEIEIKRAALYSAIAKYGSLLVQLGVTMILSRLIMPEAYGVIAITTVLIGFLNIFADMGLGINVIQHPEMQKDNIRQLFTFSLIVGAVLAFITAIASYPLSLIYNEPLYLVLCPILSIVSFIQASNVVPSSILLRDKLFKTIAFRTILCSVVSGVVAVILACCRMGIYALAIQSIISHSFLFVWNYAYTPIIPTSFKLKKVVGLLGSYSTYQVLFNIFNYFTRNLDNLVIGRYFGPAPLAQYNKSYILYLYPNNIFAAVLTGVLHPYIRDYKKNLSQMFYKYLQIEKILSLIGIFTMITFFTCSKEIVLIMFGENWEPAGIYLKCLSLCMWTQMMGSTSGSFFLGLERTDQTFKCGIINLTLIITSIFIGVYFKSMVVLSLSVAVSYNLIFIITNYILVKKTMHIRLKEFFKPLVYDALFVFCFVFAVHFLPEVPSDYFLSFTLKLFACVVAYTAYLTVSRQWNTILVLKGMFG